MYRIAYKQRYKVLRAGLPFHLVRTTLRGVSYAVPSIPTLENIRVNKESFRGLLSNRAINELWFKRVESLVGKLNKLLEENQVEAPADLAELIRLSFHKPELHEVCSFASLIHNTQFAFESITPNTLEGSQNSILKSGPETLLQTPSLADSFTNEPSNPELREWIISSFGSIAEFRTLLLNSAKGIKGDGMVWLVTQATYSESTIKNKMTNAFENSENQKYGSLAIVNTYNAGVADNLLVSGQLTKLSQQKEARVLASKKKSENIEGVDVGMKKEANFENREGQNDSLTLGSTEEAEAAVLFPDRKLLPLLAIDVSPRNYLLDYGVFGKNLYLENLWNCINWDVVSKRAPLRFKQTFGID